MAAPESAPAAAVLGTKAERAATAARHYADNRPLDAALGFEGLWRDYPGDFRFLFDAAASRYKAGHHAHAFAYTQQYLADGKPEGAAKVEAEAQLRAARAALSPVSLTVSGPAGKSGPITVVAQHVARDSGDLRPTLQFPAALDAPRSTLTVELDPGTWTLRVQGQGYASVEQRVQVRTGEPASVTLVLAKVDAPARGEVPPAWTQKLMLGIAIPGGIAATVGIGVAASGGSLVGRSKTCAGGDTSPCIVKLAEGINTRDYGLMAMGAGLGLLGGGLTWAIKDPAKRRKAWIAEAAIGGTALVSTFVALFYVPRAFRSESAKVPTETAWSDFYEQFHRSPGHGISTAGFGLGAGLLTSAVVGLAVQRKFRGDLRISPVAGHGLSGLALSGRF